MQLNARTRLYAAIQLLWDVYPGEASAELNAEEMYWLREAYAFAIQLYDTMVARDVKREMIVSEALYRKG